jgi:hypothetical protein
MANLIIGTGIDLKFREEWGHPDCTIIKGEIVRWSPSNAKPQPSESEIKAWVKTQSTFSANENIKNLRRYDYPSVGDQLDDLYKQGCFSDDMAATIKAVKDNNPKE